MNFADTIAKVDMANYYTEYIRNNAANIGDTATNSPPLPGTDFSSVLAGTIQNQMTSANLTSSPLRQDDAQTALLMLCMMMQTNQDSDYSMIMQMMSSMLTQIIDDKEALRNNVMSSEYDPYVLDTLNNGVFMTNMPGVTGTGGAVMPVEQWKPATPAITSNMNARNPELYRAVINQFQVETAERYRPFRDGNTYCNIYVWDVTRAMGAEIPLYTDQETAEPRYYPNIKEAVSMGATAMDQWLSTHGQMYGWHEVDAETAQKHANQGRPAVTSSGSLGHVQIICPSRDGKFDRIRGVTTAQAGRIVTNYTHISGIYGNNSLNNKVRYWVHA